MDLSNVTKIVRAGAPDTPVIEGMTTETTMEVMGITISDYTSELSADGKTLTLIARSGDKGALDSQVITIGEGDDAVQKVVPVSTSVFPSNEDIKVLAELFPEDNLFETLHSGKLNDYLEAIKAYQDHRVQSKALELKNARTALIEKTVDTLIDNRQKLIESASAFSQISTNLVAVISTIEAQKEIENAAKIAKLVEKDDQVYKDALQVRVDDGEADDE